MHGCNPQHRTRACQTRVYTLHLFTVLLEGQEIRAALRSSLISLTVYIIHVALVLTALLRRGNDI